MLVFREQEGFHAGSTVFTRSVASERTLDAAFR
jgi:hypothetical protein